MVGGRSRVFWWRRRGRPQGPHQIQSVTFSAQLQDSLFNHELKASLFSHNIDRSAWPIFSATLVSSLRSASGPESDMDRATNTVCFCGSPCNTALRQVHDMQRYLPAFARAALEFTGCCITKPGHHHKLLTASQILLLPVNSPGPRVMSSYSVQQRIGLLKFQYLGYKAILESDKIASTLEYGENFSMEFEPTP